MADGIPKLNIKVNKLVEAKKMANSPFPITPNKRVKKIEVKKDTRILKMRVLNVLSICFCIDIIPTVLKT